MAGAQLVKTQGASGYTGKVQTYNVVSGHSSLLAIGDFVSETGTGTADGLAGVDATAATGLITGVIVGFAPNISNLEQKGLPAGTAGNVFVEVDPSGLYELEISNGALTVANIGQNADIVATAATSSGNLVRSNMTLNGASPGSATAQMRIIGLVPATDGTALGANGNLALVRINESFIKGVVGV